MEAQFQTSFIPQKGMVPKGGKRSTLPKRSISFFALLSILIFVLSVVASAGIFFWGRYSSGQLYEAEKKLSQEVQKLNTNSNLQVITRLDDRIKATKIITANHVAPSTFFDNLGNVTVQSVRFVDLSFVEGESDRTTFTLSGEALSFGGVALQADMLEASSAFTNIAFSNLGTVEGGGVTFSVYGEVVEESILYKNEIEI
jgi:hypothetical protein